MNAWHTQGIQDSANNAISYHWIQNPMVAVLFLLVWVIELGAISVQAAVQEGVQAFYPFGVPAEERTGVQIKFKIFVFLIRLRMYKYDTINKNRYHAVKHKGSWT